VSITANQKEQAKIKRFRRPANEIDRLFTCPI